MTYYETIAREYAWMAARARERQLWCEWYMSVNSGRPHRDCGDRNDFWRDTAIEWDAANQLMTEVIS